MYKLYKNHDFVTFSENSFAKIPIVLWINQHNFYFRIFTLFK